MEAGLMPAAATTAAAADQGDEAGRERGLPATGETASASGASWAAVHDEIQAYRAKQPSAMPLPKELVFDLRRSRLYFVAMDPSLVSKVQTLYYADLSEVLAGGPTGAPGAASGTPALAAAVTAAADLEWRPLLGKGAPARPDKLSKEEQLLRERMRIGASGIASYLFDAMSEQLLFAVGGSLFLAHTSTQPALRPLQLRRSDSGPRLDHKLGGRARMLVSFVRGGDLWLFDVETGRERQLSFAAEKPGMSCGAPDYVTQEEFHRFSGYWWSPDGSGRILAVEIDESAVETVSIPTAVANPQSASPEVNAAPRNEEHRYPRAGRTNARSDLVLLEFQADTLSQFTDGPVVVKRLWGEFSLARRYPWFEYLPRLGWLPDGKSVWVQGLDRRHSRTAFLKLSLAEFMTEVEYELYRADRALLALIQVPPLFEDTSDVWINITDILHFLSTGDEHWSLPSIGGDFPSSTSLLLTPPDHPSSPLGAVVPVDVGEDPMPVDGGSRVQAVGASPLAPSGVLAPSYSLGWETRPVQFVVSSERTGFRHLYLVTYTPAGGVTEMRPLTSGSWVVLDSAITVDPQRRLVYFMAKQDTPLESHLYVASYAPDAQSDQIVRLTALGYSHAVTFDTAKADVIRGPAWFTTTYSSVHEPGRTAVCRLVFAPVRRGLERGPQGAVFPTVQIAARLAAPEVMPVDVPVPTFFNFENDLGATIHGCFYLPARHVAGGPKLPTFLKVYGGPHSQLVTNDYKFPKLLQLFLAVQMGFAVVMIDGRGSYNRGVTFESHLKYRMGTVELEDQIQGLDYLDRTYGFVDRTRVAVSGWSYGGYVSLMAIAQRSDVFKVAVCGAPVTTWELYDTGYTERYMGLPSEHADAYAAGSVLSYAADFPAAENRVLLVHGLMDENVHFRHTEALAAELIKMQKPYQLQVYPNERHGIRQPLANAHFETLLFHFLRNHL